ncbi:antitoxin VbhA family protein [Priestia endophytica]|uniref:antitoxin VbhA family protein n=1 Tax=Priestia endophytica TaxID=135735 RepID=UPI002281F8A7|nr:antitoxin VbhA family protein [Priestia endophytica]MCY8233454.1 antitoxin VbhA family protein [Priestia endophytica]
MDRNEDFDFDRAMGNVKANFAVEGLEFTEEEVELIRRRFTGKITEEEFKKMVMEIHGENLDIG